jgi:murein DD-endopeptidase MepM/ murein hydrolase activator NlpD
MLRNIILLVVFVCLGYAASAASSDTLYIANVEGRTVLIYNVQLGETIFMLAKRFHCPPAILADANGLSYRNTLKDSTTIKVPLGDYNFIKTKPDNYKPRQIKRLYYKMQTGESDYFSVSRSTGVDREYLKQWNRNIDNMLQAGDIVLAGWILYDESQVPGYKEAPVKVVFEDAKNKTTVSDKKTTSSATLVKPEEKAKSKINVIDEEHKAGAKPKVADKLTAKELVTFNPDTSKFKTSDAEITYMKQTQNETKLQTEKGPVVFFDMIGGKSGNVFLGFHSNVPRGTIIKVYNPGTGKAVFVKILGALPETKQYYNSIMGISSDAKEALGIKETRLWCELSFAEKE